jgi:hypothetical protein
MRKKISRGGHGMVTIEGWKGNGMKGKSEMREGVVIQKSEYKNTEGRNKSSKKERDDKKI